MSTCDVKQHHEKLFLFITKGNEASFFQKCCNEKAQLCAGFELGVNLFITELTWTETGGKITSTDLNTYHI